MLSQSRAGPPSAAGRPTTPTPRGTVGVKQNLFSEISSKLRDERIDESWWRAQDCASSVLSRPGRRAHQGSGMTSPGANGLLCSQARRGC